MQRLALHRATAQVVKSVCLPTSAPAKDVLGFDAGRTLSHIADHATALPPCDLVQLAGLAGGIARARAIKALLTARILNTLVTDVTTAEALLEDS